MNPIVSHMLQVLIELREKRKQSSWAKVGEMPKEAQSFSGFQLERLKKRSAMQKRLDVVGNQATEEQSTLLDQKLFVGDRAALREQKKKKQIIGHDFVFVETERSSEAAPVPGTSNDDDDALEVEQGDELTQHEILATLQPSSSKATLQEDKEALLSSDDDDEILLVAPSEASVLVSRRRGGGGISRSERASPKTEPEPSRRVKSEESSSSDGEESFVEVSVDPTAKPQEEEDDIFADVFAQADSHDKLEALLASNPSTSKHATVEVTAAIKSAVTAISKNEDSNKESDMAKSCKDDSNEESEKAKNRKAVLFKEFDMAKDRKDDSNKEVNSNLASSLKEKGHLFLQIAAKWAEESQRSKAKLSEDGTQKREKKAQEAAAELHQQLEKDRELLLSEMRETENKERLLRAARPAVGKANSTRALHIPVTSSYKNDERKETEEKKMLEDIGVAVYEKNEYDSQILGHHPSASNREETSCQKGDEEVDDTIFGASAPGFVRSGRDGQKVVEVPRSERDSDEIQVGNPRGHSDAVLDHDQVEGLLSRAELERIQLDLARDQDELVAERGRQERLGASISDQMYADCQELLQLFGLPWLVAPSEAEAQCAFLDMNGLTHGTITDDSDIWVFGGQRVRST